MHSCILLAKLYNTHMNEFYDGPAVDKFVTISSNGILPEEAYATPQGIVANLRDGEWAPISTSYGTAYCDSRSGTMLVDTYDPTLDSVSERMLPSTPFIMAVSTNGLRRYILDMRRLRSLRLSTMNLGIDSTLGSDPFESETMRLRRKNRGAEIISAFLVRNYGEVHAYAEKSLEVPAAIFAQQVDDFLLANKDQLQAGKLVPAPILGMTKADMNFHHDEQTEMEELKRQIDG